MAATEEKKYLINVESNLDDYTYQVKLATIEVDKLKESQKDAEKQFGKNSKEYIIATAELKEAQKAQKQATTTLEKMTAAQKANGTSYNDLYKQWVAAEDQLKSLEGTVQRNADGTITLTDEYKKAKTQVAEAKAAVDKFNLGVNNGTTSVGQYTKGVQEALKQTGLFGGAFNVIGDVKGKFTGAVDGVKNFASSFSTVKAAIASTGIGLLIIAIGSLVAWFQKSAEGGKIMKQAMAAVGEVFNTLVGTLTKVGGLLKDVFTGDWSKLKNDVKGIGDEWSNIGKNIKTAMDLVELDRKITKDKRQALVDEASITKDIAKLRLDAADKTKTMAERAEALKKSLQLEKELSIEKNKIADLELEKANKALAIKKQHTTKVGEELQAVAEATAKKLNIEREEYERSKRATSQLTEFYKQEQQKIFNDKKARLEAEGILAEGNYAKMRDVLIRQERLEESQADITASQKYLLRVKLNKALIDLDKNRGEEQKKIDKTIAEDTLKFEQQIDDDLTQSDSTFRENMLNSRKTDAAARLETRRIEADGDLQILQDILDEEYKALTESDEYKNSSAAQRALMDAQYAEQSKNIAKGIADNQIALDQKVLAQKQQTFEATADLLGATAELMGKNTLIGKSLAIAQATINTYLAASKALASAPNPVVGAIMAAAAIAMGLVQVKQIMAVKVSKTGGSAGAPSGGGGKTVSSSFTAANQQIAQSQTQNANADRLGTIQQNVNNQTALSQTAQATSQPQKVEVALSVEAFESQAAKKNQVEVKSNI